jgi:hypothetical protein
VGGGDELESRPGGRRILLGDNTGDGAVIQRSYQIPVLEFGFKVGCLLYTCACVADNRNTQFRLVPDIPELFYVYVGSGKPCKGFPAPQPQDIRSLKVNGCEAVRVRN